MSGRFETTTALLNRNGDVLSLTYRKNAHETLQTAQELFEAMARLVGDAPRFLIVDIRGLKGTDRDARRFWAENKGGTRAIAVLVTRGLSRVLGNFWLTVNKPRTPTKLFATNDDALTWFDALRATEGEP